MLNLTRYAPGCRVRNWTTGCVTGCPVAPLDIHCCPVREPDARRAVQLSNRAMESCPVRQPDARRAAQLVNRALESCAVGQPGDGELPG